MESCKWSEYVNHKFYGLDAGFLDNREKTEFKSGRTIFYLKNSKPKKTYAVNLELNDSKKIEGLTEFKHFLSWFETETKSGTVPVSLSDFEAQEKLYLIKETPTWSGQKYKEINLTFEEV